MNKKIVSESRSTTRTPLTFCVKLLPQIYEEQTQHGFRVRDKVRSD